MMNDFMIKSMTYSFFVTFGSPAKDFYLLNYINYEPSYPVIPNNRDHNHVNLYY